MGLPELSLGILPGFGGTQRLPRLVGLQQAIQMMLTSKPIKDKAALKLGLVDSVVPAENLLAAAKSLALEIAEGLKPRNYSLFRFVLGLCQAGCTSVHKFIPESRQAPYSQGR